MFSVSKAKKKNSNYPIARFIGGENHGKYLYYNKIKSSSIDDIDSKLKEDLDPGDLSILDIALKNNVEPDSEILEKRFYMMKDYLKNKSGKYLLKSGKLEVLPNFNIIEKLYICGVSGSGKSTFSANWAKRYLQKYRKNELYILSNVDADPVLDKLNPCRINLTSVIEDPLSPDELDSSLIIFDDIGTIENPQIRKASVGFLNNILECGRHYNCTCISTSHVIMDYSNSKKSLVESTSVVIFLKGSQVQNKRYMENYCGFSKEQITKILNLNSRWVCISRVLPLIIHERGVFLI